MKTVPSLLTFVGACLFACALSTAPARPEDVPPAKRAPGLRTDPVPGIQRPIEPTGEITLGDALAAALLGSPSLAAFSWEVRAREARTLQAGLLPNPQILVELENVGSTSQSSSFEQSETTIWLSQQFLVGGKRGKRVRVAEIDRRLAEWDYERARLGVVTDATKAFVSTLAAQQQVALATDLERLATESVQSVRRLAEAGGATPVDVTRAEVEQSSAALRRRRAEGSLTVFRAALAATWGSATPRFVAARGELEPLGSPLPLEALERLVDANPDLARWDTELDRQSSALSLERARWLPDPTLSLGGRHFNDNGDTALVLAVSLPLPVFDRNQGNVLAAARGVQKAKAERASAEVSVKTALRQRHADLLVAQDQAETLARETIPAAVRAFEDTRRGHGQGLYRALDVLDAQRTLFELRLQQVGVLTSYHLARADLERLIATPLSSAGLGEAP